VALGSNIGDREAHLSYARARLGALPGTRVVAVSSVEETAPIGPVAQPPYLNQMVLLETSLRPAELLAHCRTIEASAAGNGANAGGRARSISTSCAMATKPCGSRT